MEEYVFEDGTVGKVVNSHLDIVQLEERIEALEGELRLVHRKLRSYELNRYELIKGVVIEVLNGHSLNMTFGLASPPQPEKADKYRRDSRIRCSSDKRRNDIKSEIRWGDENSLQGESSDEAIQSQKRSTRSRSYKSRVSEDSRIEEDDGAGHVKNVKSEQLDLESGVEITDSGVTLLLEPTDSADSDSAGAEKSPKKKRIRRPEVCDGTEGRYKCQFCDKSFSFHYVLERHQRKHTNERPFRCDLCEPPSTYTQTSNLYKHIRTKHPGAEPPRIKRNPHHRKRI